MALFFIVLAVCLCHALPGDEDVSGEDVMEAMQQLGLVPSDDMDGEDSKWLHWYGKHGDKDAKLGKYKMFKMYKMYKPYWYKL